MIITTFLTLFAVATLGYFLGPNLLSDRSRILTTIWGTLGIIMLFILIRSLWFYAGGLLDSWGDIWTLAITILLSSVWIFFNRKKSESSPSTPYSLLPTPQLIFSIISITLSLAAFLLIAWSAFKAGTTESIRTPWPLMPEWTLPMIGLIWALTLAMAWRLKNTFTTAIQLTCVLGSTFLIAPLLYKIGYGFDGFLHVAGERILSETGTLMPKPPYYMGQYNFVTWFSKLFELNIADVDRWLVPLSAAILIPLAAYLVFQKDKAAMIAGCILVPISAFVATTPHGCATLLGIVALILTINRIDNGINAALPLLFAAAAAITHPLVGLPVLSAVVMSTIYSSSLKTKLRIPLTYAFAVITGISVPLVFGLASVIGSGAGVSFDLGKLFELSAWSGIIASWIPWVTNRFVIWPEASVWITKLLPIMTIVFACLSLRRTTGDPRLANLPWLIASLSAFLASVMLRLVGDFDFLIDYERGNYAERLALVAWILLLPPAIPSLGRALDKAAHAAYPSAVAILLAVGLLGAGASYAALPRHDAATASRGWSVGIQDIEAVRLIDEDSEGRDYTVLANQSVSAAAVREYGFKRYHDDIFFYPIPTGGELYEIFLIASYEEPDQETMALAGKLGGSDLVYFVVNDYWWKAEELIEKAKRTANREFIIQDGKVHVFRYDLLSPVKIEESNSM